MRALRAVWDGEASDTRDRNENAEKEGLNIYIHSVADWHGESTQAENGAAVQAEQRVALGEAQRLEKPMTDESQDMASYKPKKHNGS